MKLKSASISLTLVVLSGSTVFAASAKPITGHAELKNSKGDSLGKAILTQSPHGVEVKVDLARVSSVAKSSELAIHVHETGKCEGPDFKSAGGHFNPGGKEHGFGNPKGHHAGDTQSPLVPSKSGEIHASFTLADVTLEGGKPNSLFKEGGTSLVIHDGLDDQKSQPAGNSGNRVVCGVIEK